MKEKVKKVLVEQEIRFSRMCESKVDLKFNLVVLCCPAKPKYISLMILWNGEHEAMLTSPQGISILERLELYVYLLCGCLSI